MADLFLKIVNMSIAASWAVLAVLVLRLMLKKAPKWANVLLWGVVAVRLICPVSFESALSLIPSTETIPGEVLSGPSFDVHTGITPVDDRVNEYLGDRYFEGVTVPPNNGMNIVSVLTIIWISGMVLLLAYTAFSYFRLRFRVKEAVLYRDQVYMSEYAAAPFVLGILRPRIYLPYTIAERNIAHVIAHEQAHIRRRDHWWKPLGFVLLTVHWFNPLMWAAYILLCRDIELACDEKVIRELGLEQRADYSQALLACSVKRRTIAACPLAFGEVGVKERVKTVLSYKKPAFWIIVTAVIACIIVAVCFLTDPKDDNTSGFYKDKMLSVKIVDSDGAVLGEPRWNYYEIEEFDGVTLPGSNTVDFSVRKVSEGTIDVLFDSILVWVQEHQEVTQIRLRAGSSIELVTPTPGGCTYYTFSVVDNAKVNIDAADKPVCFPALEDLPSDYSLQQAKLDGCVVMEDGDVTSGKDIWWTFLHTVRQAEAAQVRYVTYWSEKKQGNHESIEERYPAMYIHDLVFDGEMYTVRWYEGDAEIVRNYRYLLYSAGDAESPSVAHESYRCYFLTNTRDAQWEDIWAGLISAQSGAYIDYLSVYIDKIYAEDPTLSELESAKRALEPYMIAYGIAVLDANEITDTLDIEIREQVDGLEELVAQFIDLKHVRISFLEGELEFVGAEEDRLPMGTYAPVRCAYMSPLSSYLPVDLPGDIRYYVTEDGIETEADGAFDSRITAPVNWQWKTMEKSKVELAFLNGTFFGNSLTEDCLYQKLGTGYYIIEDKDTLYLVRSGDTRSEFTRIWSIYVLESIG